MFFNGNIIHSMNKETTMESSSRINEKIRWEPIEFTYVGKIRDIVRGGGGKLSLPFDDKGDAPRKPKGQE
jgi:hypothetical protein